MGNTRLLCGVIISLLFLSLLSFSVNTHSEETKCDLQKEEVNDLSDLVASTPLVITHNDNFTTSGFTGAGTEGNPYIIENLSISSDSICVNVTDTTAHFIIRNCYISSETSPITEGVYFDNVDNGTVEDCEITWKNKGVYMTSSYDCIFDNVEISNTTSHGIHLVANYYCDFTNCYIHEQGASAYGIYENSNYGVYYNCTIEGALYGIFLNGGSPTIDSCFIRNNDDYGIYVTGATSPDIINTFIQRNDLGIYSSSGNQRYYYNNTISHNDGMGIWLHNTASSNFTYNKIFNNDADGIWLEGFTQSNYFYGNQFGWNSPNVQDDSGRTNYFDDGVSLGNAWSDYGGGGTYTPSGSISTDNYPTLLDDSTYPTVIPADNVTFGEGTSGNYIEWDVEDEFPDTYTLYIDDIPTVSDWLGEDVEISLDSLSVGLHNITLVVTDCGGQSSQDTVFADVYMFDLEPEEDMAFESGTGDNWLNWEARCAFPVSFEIHIDEVEQVSGSWDGTDISYNLDQLSLGSHNITLILTNSTAHQLIDQVDVDVYDTTAPEIDDLGYYIYELGYPKEITWSASDHNPASYEILKNGSTIHEGPWIGGEVEILIQNHEIGLFNYTMVLTDEGNNEAIDTMLVLVSDTKAPSITQPDDITVEEGVPEISIIWTVQDYNNGTYIVYVNGDEYDTGSSFSGDIEIDTSSFSSGTYNVTLVATDDSENSAIDTVWLTVEENTAPSVEGPSTIEITEGQTGVWIRWNCSDSHPDEYEICVNDSMVLAGGWDGYDIFYPLSNLPAGNHNLTLTIRDIQGLQSSHTVEVMVSPSTTTTTTSTTDSTETTTSTSETTSSNNTFPSDILEQLESLRTSMILIGLMSSFAIIVSIVVVIISRRSG